MASVGVGSSAPAAPTGAFRLASSRGVVSIRFEADRASGRLTPVARPVGTDFKAFNG